jgi:hypothetical protein
VIAYADPVAETSANQIVGSLPMPLPPKEKRKGREDCEMLEKICDLSCSSPETDRRFRFKP